MSNRYPGGVIRKTPVVPTATSASGFWTLDQMSAARKTGTWPRSPGAPTIGTATNLDTGGRVSVTFTAPTDAGSTAITQYTVTSNPGNITATGASSPITVNGLTNNTPYTFTVQATNAAGTGPSSAASNSATPTQPVTGQQVYSSASGLSFSWVAPAGVSSVSFVVVSPGGTGGSTQCSCILRGGAGGGGGALLYNNDVPVTAGNSYTVTFSNTYNQKNWFISCSSYGYVTTAQNGCVYTTIGVGGTRTGGAGGGNGGNGGQGNQVYRCLCGFRSTPGGGGGGGAAGYSGNGGTGGTADPITGSSGSGGGGGGGGGGSRCSGSWINGNGAGGGGGVGLLGSGSNGTAGGRSVGGGAGSSGATGGSGSGNAGGAGGLYGGGGGGASTSPAAPNGAVGSRGPGGVRIIWPGNSRQFPSTCTGDL